MGNYFETVRYLSNLQIALAIPYVSIVKLAPGKKHRQVSQMIPDRLIPMSKLKPRLPVQRVIGTQCEDPSGMKTLLSEWTNQSKTLLKTQIQFSWKIAPWSETQHLLNFQ